jgi:hypothetical protein
MGLRPGRPIIPGFGIGIGVDESPHSMPRVHHTYFDSDSDSDPDTDFFLTVGNKKGRTLPLQPCGLMPLSSCPMKEISTP